MKRSQKGKLIITIVILFFVISGAVALYVLKDNEVKDTVVMGIDDFKGIPDITTVAPLSGRVGEVYVYDVRVVDSDSDDLFLELVDSPSWLYIEDGYIVKGIPMEKGSYKFVLKVSDGINYSLQENYILVEDNRE